MKDYVVQYGQSIYDLSINLYGDLSKVWDIIDDNGFVNGLDTDLEGGQVVLIREGVDLNANTITEYFTRFPAIVNNSDYEYTGIVGVLEVILKAIGNEVKGGDGYILIDVVGGSAPYSFEWKNQDTGEIISNSQNLTAASAGRYSVTVTDADGIVVTLTDSIIVADTVVYIIDEFGNYIVDGQSNNLIE